MAWKGRYAVKNPAKYKGDPTKETVIDDPAPVLFLPDASVVAIIPCRAAAWEGKL